jgi:acetyl esterase
MAEHFVRPDVRKFLDWFNNLDRPRGYQLGAEAARELMIASRHALDVPLGELAVVRDFAGPGAEGLIRLRLYDCREERGPGPIIVFYHGGGFVVGDIDTHEPLCADISRGLDLPVVSVDYRRAPESPFPAGVQDCLTVTRWLAEGPEELGLEPEGLILAGDSSGGNFALVVTAALRDEPAAVPVIAQWAIYPAADPGTKYPSKDEFGRDHLLTIESMDWYDECYTGVKKDWRYSPLLKGCEGLPPTFVLTAGLDPIRDQGRAYAAACAAAGVKTVYWEAEGTIHGFLSLRKAIPSANEDLRLALQLFRTMIGNKEAG